MKKIYSIFLFLTIVAYVQAQQEDHSGHDHAKKAAPAQSGHEGHDNGAEGAGHDDHEGHDDGSSGEEAHDDHEGHDHGDQAAGGIELSEEMITKLGLKILEAQGGTVALSSIFPAEIKLNRDRSASVSPRYPSIVRQVFAEIGDTVKKGDVLASLENRETMAVYTVSAPQNGTIISKDLAVGETAGEDSVLYKVADLSSVWADISIFPEYQHLVQKNTVVTFVAHDGHTAKGKIKYVSPIVSHETRTLTARCVLEGATEDFKPGAFVRAEIVVKQVNARVVVPREAIQRIEGESVIFTPSEHGFVATPVQTGTEDDLSIEIRGGLKPNDRYVAVGAFALKAQMVTSGMDPHAGHGH
ncbi:efflux RND transporter periplasmic adaptor subunit [Pontiellaceae bacterium B12219]|nr:efflux RND transporter periplasmic adaptor subunit [Pontiellaceae bacterium B12219]